MASESFDDEDLVIFKKETAGVRTILVAQSRLHPHIEVREQMPSNAIAFNMGNLRSGMRHEILQRLQSFH